MTTAVTETNTIIEIDDGIVTHHKPGQPAYSAFKALTMATAPSLNNSELPMPWDDPDNVWTPATQPEVGRRFYVAGMGGWYISTTIVSVD